MKNTVAINVKCPLCHADLMDETHLVDKKPGIKLGVQVGEKEGTVWLSAVYGSYKHKSDIVIDKKQIVDFFCPHCKMSIVTDVSCAKCRAPVAYMYLAKGGRINFCTRNGCTQHSLQFEDIAAALMNFYGEFEKYGEDFNPEK